jgi:hypothetical protein
MAAYRFPLVGWRAGSAKVDVWGRAPASGAVVVQARTGGGWKTVRRLRLREHDVFLAQIARRGAVDVRALDGSQTSLAWSAR